MTAENPIVIATNELLQVLADCKAAQRHVFAVDVRKASREHALGAGYTVWWFEDWQQEALPC